MTCYSFSVAATGRVINKQRHNDFSSNSLRICNQFEKVHPSASLTKRISRLGDSVKTKLFPSQGKVGEISQNSIRNLAKILRK